MGLGRLLGDTFLAIGRGSEGNNFLQSGFDATFNVPQSVTYTAGAGRQTFNSGSWCTSPAQASESEAARQFYNYPQTETITHHRNSRSPLHTRRYNPAGIPTDVLHR